MYIVSVQVYDYLCWVYFAECFVYSEVKHHPISCLKPVDADWDILSVLKFNQKHIWIKVFGFHHLIASALVRICTLIT